MDAEQGHVVNPTTESLAQCKVHKIRETW